MPPDFPGVELAAGGRQEHGKPLFVQGDDFGIHHEVLLAVGDEQVVEAVGLQQLFEARRVRPETLQLLPGTGKRPGPQQDGVVVDQVSQAHQDGLVLEVEVIKPVDQVAPADTLA